MNVIIDARMVTEHLHGIARYTYELVKGMSKEKDINIKLLINDQAVSKKIFGEFENIEYIVMKSRFLSVMEQFELPWIINKYDKDTIFHSPSFVSSPFIKIPMIMTIHDLNHLKFPQYYSPFHKYYYKYIVKPSALKCRKILTVSEFSKKELTKWLECSVDKVAVTYNGVDKKFKVISDRDKLRKVRDKYGLPEKFVLYIGNLKPHKNVETLVEAMKSVEDTGLIINGQPNESLNKIISKYNLNDKVKFIGYVDESDLPAIYNLASVFVFPSLYEGFGLPPLEAMSSGCPAIVSDAASLPEVTGDDCEHFRPKDIDALGKLINETLLRNERINNHSITDRFNWDKCVRETLKIYEGVIRCR